MVSAMFMFLIFYAIIYIIVDGIRSIFGAIKEEKFRQQKEKEYLDSINKWKELDMMDYYMFLVEHNEFERKKYYSTLPEFRPKESWYETMNNSLRL